MTYIIAYDIASPRRLRRVAKVLERYALRCQKSVFVADLSADQVQAVLEEARREMDESADLLQAWRLSSQGPVDRWNYGSVVPAETACIVVGSTALASPNTANEPPRGR